MLRTYSIHLRFVLFSYNGNRIMNWTPVLFLLLAAAVVAQQHPIREHHDDDNDHRVVQARIINAKMELWSRGAYAFDSSSNGNIDEASLARSLEDQVQLAPLRLGPVRQGRRDTLRRQQQQQHHSLASPWWNQWRGGADTSSSNDGDDAVLLQKLGAQFGPEFTAAIDQNRRDHAADCQKSCELFYCAPPVSPLVPLEDLLAQNETTIASYSFGPVPPEDFAETFGYVCLFVCLFATGAFSELQQKQKSRCACVSLISLYSATIMCLFSFPLDLIKVTQGKPLFSEEEAARVIENAEAEGVDKNEYKSGKYKLGGDWLVNLPKTREWFNERLETTFFPLLAHLFPEVISSPAALRAHSVSLLKYNSSHPRTDVHIDNGILALTVAMTQKDQYVGGGTFFEHMGEEVLQMEVGHGTFRPGSVRHGGHPVTSGTRYILGGFLLLEDRVENVRRLKNRGTELRRANELEKAAQHFEWALAINPKCTTCLKDWAEILHTQKQFAAAEEKMRTALELLENKDSDALFTLGILLSEQGRDDESIEAYQQSVKLNADDAELCYNLGIKLGAKGKAKEEMEMYARAVEVDPTFGGAWLNWGTALAERGELDDVCGLVRRD